MVSISCRSTWSRHVYHIDQPIYHNSLVCHKRLGTRPSFQNTAAVDVPYPHLTSCMPANQSTPFTLSVISHTFIYSHMDDIASTRCVFAIPETGISCPVPGLSLVTANRQPLCPDHSLGTIAPIAMSCVCVGFGLGWAGGYYCCGGLGGSVNGGWDVTRSDLFGNRCGDYYSSSVRIYLSH